MVLIFLRQTRHTYERIIMHARQLCENVSHSAYKQLLINCWMLCARFMKMTHIIAFIPFSQKRETTFVFHASEKEMENLHKKHLVCNDNRKHVFCIIHNCNARKNFLSFPAVSHVEREINENYDFIVTAINMLKSELHFDANLSFVLFYGG